MEKIVKISQTISYWTAQFLLRFLLHYQIEGQENLRELEEKAIIFASNHASYVDSLLGAVSLPRTRGCFYPAKFFPIRFLASGHFLAHPIKNIFIIFYIWIHGSIWVKKGRGDLQTALKEVVLALKKGEKVWIFPEGKRSRDGKLGQGKRGVAYLHKETGAPIVPVAFIGTFRILSPKAFLKAFFGFKKIKVVFGKPICSLDEGSLEQGVDKVMSAIKELMI